MHDQPFTAPNFPDPTEMSKSMTSIAEKSQRLVSDFVSRQMSSGTMAESDPRKVGEAFAELSRHMMANPAQVMESNLNLWNDYLTLWQTTTQRMMGADVEPTVSVAHDDYRFKDDAWTDNHVFQKLLTA